MNQEENKKMESGTAFAPGWDPKKAVAEGAGKDAMPPFSAPELAPQKAVAERVKGLRQTLHISTEEMAKVAGIPEEAYQEFEAGESDFSFTFIYKCASRFGVDIRELITGEEPKLTHYTVTRKNEGMPIKRRNKFEYLHVAPMMKDRFSDPFVVTAKYSEEEEKAPITLSTHRGQEMDFVLEGALKVQVNGKIEILRAGDSIYYDASLPHGMIAADGEDCTFLAIVIKGEKTSETGRDASYQTIEQHMPGTDAGEEGAFAGKKAETTGEKSERTLLYQQYMTEMMDENGCVKDVAFHVPETFNFGFDVVDTLAEKDPDNPAMVWVSRDHEKKVFTFRDISDYSSMTANYLQSMGIGKGDKVMLILKRHYQFWFAINAIHKLGAVVIPATNLLTKKDLEYRFQTGDVKAVICTGDGEVAAAVDAALPASKTVKTRIMVNGKREGWEDFDKGIAAHSTDFARPAGKNATKRTDPMLMYFSSGTTGYPKLVVHNYAYPLGHIMTARWWHNVDPDGLHFTISDTGWGKSVWGKLYGQWLCEAAVFTYDFDKFEAQDILPMFQEHHITTFCAPPTMYRFFIKEDLSKYDLSSLQYATIAGEALNPEVFQQFYNATGIKLMEGFGQTETTLAVANFIGTEPKPGSMGKPNPQYDVDLVTPEGTPAKEGEVGEIVIRTDKRIACGMFDGYYKEKEKTEEAWNHHIYHTGDMAWRDEDGYFWYVGRTDDLIKSSGYRIGPFEIENVIMELPYVLECAVTGEPDEIRGQLVKATIVLTTGTERTEELKKEIQAYVKKHTAPYKYPRIVAFADSLPKTISGKIRRVEIRNQKS